MSETTKHTPSTVETLRLHAVVARTYARGFDAAVMEKAADELTAYHAAVDDDTERVIPTDLASLLRRCREREIIATREYDSAHLEYLWRVRLGPRCSSRCVNGFADTTALLHALAGLHDAKEAGRE